MYVHFSTIKNSNLKLSWPNRYFSLRCGLNHDTSLNLLIQRWKKISSPNGLATQTYYWERTKQQKCFIKIPQKGIEEGKKLKKWKPHEKKSYLMTTRIKKFVRLDFFVSFACEVINEKFAKQIKLIIRKNSYWKWTLIKFYNFSCSSSYPARGTSQIL
jgi:hypothetical protein